MATTKIRGNTQIMSGTITDTQISSSAAIATSKLADGAYFLKKDGSVIFTGNLQAGGFTITGLATPTNANDAATKSYVDNLINGRTWKDPVRVATTANITLSGTQTIDGVALSVADRVLVKDQTSGAENGIYNVASGSWSRSADATGSEVVAGLAVIVTEGTTNQDTQWFITTDNPITVGTTVITFQKIPGGSIGAGTGLSFSGNTLNVNLGNGVTTSSNNLTLVLNGSTLNLGSSGLKVSDGGITATQINSSALGNGLTGGSGTTISVVVTTSGGLSISGSGLSVVADSTETTKSLTISSNGVKVNLSKFVIRETPSGTIDGSNTSFSLASTPVSGTEQLFLNGLLLEPGAGNDYTISGSSLTLLIVPQTGDRLKASYTIA